MRIGIIGAGDRGAALAELLTRAGHQLAIGDPNDEGAASALAEALGPSATATSAEDAARFGDLVVLAGPFDERAIPRLAPAVTGRIVVDAMNALDPAGAPIDLGGRTSSGVVAEWLPGARIVKAFNTVEPAVLLAESRPATQEDRRLVVFVAGDDGRAKARVSTLIEEVGFTPVDTGSLAIGGRRQEPGTKLFERALLPPHARRALRLMP